MAYRSDRRGDVPVVVASNKLGSLRSRAQSIGSPRATFHRGQGTLVPNNGPEIRLQSTSAITLISCAPDRESPDTLVRKRLLNPQSST